jgi:hypothetical protein
MVHTLVTFIQTDRLCYNVIDPKEGKLAMEDETERTRFVATVNAPSQRQLSFHPIKKLDRREPLGGLRSTMVDDSNHDDAICVYVQAQLDCFILGGGGLILVDLIADG